MKNINELKGRRIIIIGCPGSGKSHFARRLAQKTGLPLHHLDLLWWREDGTHIEREKFIDKQLEIMQNDEWLIDGNYLATMALRIARADTVFYFDLPADICLESERKRRGEPRPDMPKGFLEREDADFIDFIKSFKEVSAPKVNELLDGFSGDLIIFSSREQADRYLNN